MIQPTQAEAREAIHDSCQSAVLGRPAAGLLGWWLKLQQMSCSTQCPHILAAAQLQLSSLPPVYTILGVAVRCQLGLGMMSFPTATAVAAAVTAATERNSGSLWLLLCTWNSKLVQTVTSGSKVQLQPTCDQHWLLLLTVIGALQSDDHH